jgi:bacitracin transport system permease protein
VEDSLFSQLQVLNEKNSIGYTTTAQTSINLIDADDETYQHVEKLYKQTGANVLYESEEANDFNQLSSLKATITYNLNMYGTLIFVTAFLGLAFLLATGSILYFKQMSEADEEKASYTVLRKIGFTQEELLQGIVVKQLFNFGVPLLIGLLHSYFAVKSGWFIFGTELTTPLLVTMVLYIAMYLVFALITINYYKKIIKRAL